MVRSRSSAGRMSVHIVLRSVEGRFIRTIMGEVKERSSWGGTNVSSLLDMSSTSENAMSRILVGYCCSLGTCIC